MPDPRASVTGKRIILEIVREMREGLHPLLYSRVAPGLYCVYLHPEDFSRIEGLVPRVRSEAQRALAEEMRRLNAPSKANALRWFVADDPAPPVEEPAGGWVIQIEADRDDEVAPGTFVILSKLSLPPLPQFEGGSPTTKVFKTVISGESRTKTSQVFATPPAPPAIGAPAVAATSVGATGVGTTGVGGAPPIGASTTATFVGAPGAPAAGVAAPPPPLRAPVPVVRGLAEIAVQDAHGHRIFVMDKHDIKIGRGGQFRLVDLQLDGPTRISRVHARIRRDDQGRFFIKDLSEWGTTVDGQRIARGVIREGEEVREIDVEAELPSRARIGLADALFLEFTAVPAPVGATATATTTATTTAVTRTERVRDVPTPPESHASAIPDIVHGPAEPAGASDVGATRIDDAVETHETVVGARSESADAAPEVSTAATSRVGTGAAMMQEPVHAGSPMSPAVGESAAVSRAGGASTTGRVIGAGGGRG